jgi:pimeloyl-ACP methyl ester carboxylesterase
MTRVTAIPDDPRDSTARIAFRLMLGALGSIGRGRMGFTSLPRDTLIRRYAKPTSKYVSVMGAQVHYTDEGQGETLVMIHGFGASLHTWDGLVANLKRDYRVVRLDIPPFGITGPLRDAQERIRTMDFATYREFIDTFVEALGIGRATFVGNSLGGMLAWDYTTRHPDRVDKLVLIDAAGFPMKFPLYIDLFNHAVVRWSSPHMLPEFIIRAATRDVYGDAGKIAESTYQRYTDFFYGEGNREAVGKMVPQFRFEELDTDLLKTIRQPTLILWGDTDRWIPPAHAYEFQKRIAGSALKMYPGLGHVPMEEAPELVTADVRAFLSQGAGSAQRNEE